MFKKFNFKIFLSLPFQLLLVICFVFIFGKYLSENTVRAFYSFSFFFKELLGLFLPLMVFAFITYGILSFKRKAPIILFVLISFVILSNYFVGIISYFVGTSFLPLIISDLNISELISNIPLTPLFKVKFPHLIRADKVILLSIALGMLFSFIKCSFFEKVISKLKDFVEFILLKCFIPVLPFYVLGFLLKMSYQGTLKNLFGAFGKAFLLIFIFQAIYLCFIYFVAAGFNLKKFLFFLKNSLSSYLTAFSTMSSTATIPVTIESSVKNIGNRKLCQLATPILANTHLTGDAITITILSLVTIYMFKFSQLGFYSFLTFLFYFCLTMLAAAGIPGGGIIVIMPILDSVLGFNSAMISIITTLYLLQDSFGTACNVMGDGALTILLTKFLKKIKILK